MPWHLHASPDQEPATLPQIAQAWRKAGPWRIDRSEDGLWLVTDRELTEEARAWLRGHLHSIARYYP